jgi:putative nucleotidyltransferase with HDIG domain
MAIKGCPTCKLLKAEIKLSRKKITQVYDALIYVLIKSINTKDDYTLQHSKEVAHFTEEISKELGLTKPMISRMKNSAILHDIGKIGVNESILRKKGKLTKLEEKEMKRHPEIGAFIIKDIPFIEDAYHVVLFHHERYDGKGYPKKLAKDNIPLSARIVAVADTMNAILSCRPYRRKQNKEILIRELRDNTGTQFDPKIIDVVFKKGILNKI